MSSAKRVRMYRLRKESEKKTKIDETFEFLCATKQASSTCENQFNSDSDMNSGGEFQSESENQLESETENMASDEESVCWSTVDFDCEEPVEDSDLDFNKDNSSTSADDSEEKPYYANEEPEEVNQLRTWVIESGIPRKHLDSLLKILKKKTIAKYTSLLKNFFIYHKC